MSDSPLVSSGNIYLFNNLLDHIEQLREVFYCRDILEQTPAVQERIRLMQLRGHTVQFERVDFKGGVGSFKFMIRRKKFRLQISAVVRGREQGNIISVNLFGKRKKKRYYAYAYCIEI